MPHLLLACLLLLTALPATAAPAVTTPPAAATSEGSAAPASPEAAAAAPATAGPPPVASLIARADDLAAEITSVTDDLQPPSPRLTEVRQRFPSRLAEFEHENGHLGAEALAGMSPLDISGRLQALNRLDREIDQDRAALQKEVDALDPRRATLREHLEYLDQARDPALGDEVPDSLRQRIDRLDESAARALKLLGDRIGLIVGQIDRSADLQVRVREKIRQLKAELDQRQTRLLNFSAPPLWAAANRSGETATQLVARNLGLLQAGIGEYLELRGPGFVVLGFVYVLLLVLGMRLARAGDPAGPAATAAAGTGLVARRPYTVLTLIWLLLGPELLLPELVPGLAALRGVLIIVMLWRLLPELTGPVSLVSRRALLAVMLVLILESVLLGDPFYGRIVQLGVGLAALVLVRWIRRDQTPGVSRPGLLAQVVDWLLRITPPVLMAGFAATLLGALSLGAQLTDSVLFLSLALLAYVATDGLLRDLIGTFVEGPGARWSRAIRRHPALVRQRAATVVRIGLVVAFIALVPRVAPLLVPVWDFVGGALETPVRIGTVALSLLDLLTFAASAIGAVFAARFVRFLLDEDVFPRLPLMPGSASAASRLAYYAVVSAGILFAFAAAGLELTKLTLVISALGVGIGFGLQNIVNNFVSGLVIAFEHPFREGDQIAVGSLTGRVQSIGLRASRIHTFDGAEIIVPNGNLISGEVVNWTLSDRSRRIEVTVGVGYGSDPEEVERLMLEVAVACPGVAASPAPAVIFKGFGDSSLDFSVLVWTPDADDRMKVESAIRFGLLAAFRRAGVEIPFPQRDVHVKTLPAAPGPGTRES